MKSENTGKDVVREGLDLDIQLTHSAIVEATSRLNLVLSID